MEVQLREYRALEARLGGTPQNEMKSYLVPIWSSQTGALPDSLMRTVRCKNLEVTYRCDKSRPDFRHAGIGDSGHGNTDVEAMGCR